MLTKAWEKYLLINTGFMKCKGSTSVKLLIAEFQKRKEQSFYDNCTAVVMTEIPQSHNQLGSDCHPACSCQWMEKSVPITGHKDEREVTVVLAVTTAREYLLSLIFYQGKTERCHPSMEVPLEWDLWHSENHWSRGATMVKYAKEVFLPFMKTKFEDTRLCAAIFDIFRGQQTQAF